MTQPAEAWIAALFAPSQVEDGPVNPPRPLIRLKGAGVPTVVDDPANNQSIWTFAGGGTSVGVVTLEQFGAVGDGVTSDQVAFAAALALLAASVTIGQGSKRIELGANRTYLVTGGTLPASCAIFGQGDSSILKTASNAPVIIIGGDEFTCANFQIVGTATSANQVGIQDGQFGASSSGFNNGRIDQVTFERLSTGIDLNQFVGIHNGPVITNCRFTDCDGTTFGKGGIYVGTLAEYTKITNCTFHTCGVGSQIAAGNTNMTGCIFADCTTSFWLRGDLGVTFLNDAHGVISGCTINHAVGDAVRVDAITNGMLFIGCEILGGDIRLTGSTGVRFSNCDLVPGNLYFDGSLGTIFDGCSWPQTGGVAPTVHNSYNSHPSTTRFTPENFQLDGTFPAFILANDDGSGWQHPILAALALPRQPSETPLATDPGGNVAQLITDPTHLPGSQLWLRADSGNIVTSSGNVSTWLDASGVSDSNRNHTQSTPADRPPYVASDSNYNGQPTVGPFTGSAMLLASGVWSSPPPETGTIMIVCDIPTSVAFVLDSLSAQRYAVFRNTADLAVDFGSNVTFGVADKIAARPCIIIIDMNGAETLAWVNGLLHTGSANPGSSSPTGTTIGNAQAPGTVPTGGQVAEVWISSSRLSAGQRLQLQTYAATRYGVALAPK